MKKQLVMRTLLASMLVMTFVACGKAKNGGAVRGRNMKTTAQQPPATDNTGDETADTGADTSEDGENTDSPNPNAGGSSSGETAEPTEPTAPPPTDDNNSTNTGSGNTNDSSGGTGGNSSSGNTNNPTTTTATDDSQRLLLASTQYTGAANDSLRHLLQAKMEANDDETSKKLNLTTAATIKDASWILDGQFKEVAVKFTQRINGEDKVTELMGSFDSNLVAKLSKLSGSVDAEGTLTCLDKAARSCSVAHARILLGEKGSRAVVNIIFRTTGMKVKSRIELSQDSKGLTKEQEAFHKLFTANKNNLKNSDRINDARLSMESFEVIQGRSAARIRIYTVGGEIITVKTLLVDHKVIGNKVPNLDVSMDGVDNIDLQTAQTLKTSYQSMIQEGRLLKNDKSGGLELALMVGPKDNSDSAQVLLLVSRRQIPVKGDIVNND